MKKLKLLTLILFSLSTNVFSQWQHVYTFPTAPTDMQVVDTTLYVVTTGNGLFASYDNGLSWQQKNNNISDTLITSFYADSSMLLAAVSYNAINISLDGGNSWNVSSAGILNPYVYAVTKAGNNLLCGTLGTFANDSASLNISNNNGLSWTEQVRITNYSGFPAFAVKDSFVVASSYSGDFYYSHDYGANYTMQSSFFASENMIITNSTIVAAHLGVNSSLRYSADNGLTWQMSKDSIQGEDFKNTGDTVFAATSYGFFFSFNGGMSWTEYNVGLPAWKYSYSVAIKENDIWLGHVSGDLYKLSLSQLLSVQQLSENSSAVSIFPNPVNDFLNISTKNNFTPRVELSDNTGRKVLSETSNKIYSGNLAKGIYFIKVFENEKQIAVKKLLKE